MDARLDDNTEIQRLIDEVKRGTRILSIAGLTSISAKAYVLAEVQSVTGKRFAVVTQTNEESEDWGCDLEFWTENTKTQIPNSKIHAPSSKSQEALFKLDFGIWHLVLVIYLR